jgi:hypothetical protein
MMVAIREIVYGKKREFLYATKREIVSLKKQDRERNSRIRARYIDELSFRPLPTLRRLPNLAPCFNHALDPLLRGETSVQTRRGE